VATPEKALLDLLYLEPDADTEEYLNELRLQHLDTLYLGGLNRLAEQFGKPKLLRAAGRVARMTEQEALEYERYEGRVDMLGERHELKSAPGPTGRQILAQG
jgi:hypothetical protein